MGDADFDQREFRNVLGNFCTGVVVATGCLEGLPAGFAAQSFVSLSLQPPLIALCPAKSSTSWPKLRASGSFCVNVLAVDQRRISDAMAQPGGDAFEEFDWQPSGTGSPVLDGVIAYIDCELVDEHEAGDHTIAVGQVRDFRVLAGEKPPLLFFQGSYGSFGSDSVGDEPDQ